MTTVGVFEARSRFSELLEMARKGERIIITKRGIPAAMLVPIESRQTICPAEAVSRLRELRRAISPMAGISLRDLIDDGRRY